MHSNQSDARIESLIENSKLQNSSNDLPAVVRLIPSPQSQMKWEKIVINRGIKTGHNDRIILSFLQPQSHVKVSLINTPTVYTYHQNSPTQILMHICMYTSDDKASKKYDIQNQSKQLSESALRCSMK